MSRHLRTLALLAAALAAPTAALATSVQMAPDASIHRVEIAGGIRHTVVRDGTAVVTLVPGTDDAAPDTDPALEIDPVTAAAVVVWSRDDGAGFDVWIARNDAGTWSAPRRLLGQPGTDDLAPRIQIGEEAVHVVARGEEGYLRVTLDRSSLETTIGPETLPAPASVIVPGVQTQPGFELPPGSVYFASDVLSESPDLPGQVVIWGVRDEPVPIDFVEALVMPAAVGNPAEAPLAMPIEGSLAVLVPAQSRVWYTFRLQGTWDAFRAVDMDESMSMADVKLMVGRVIRRLSE